MPEYCLVESNGYITNLLGYDTKPDSMLHHSGHMLVENTVGACIGWSYINGTFIKPVENPNPPEIPKPPPDPRDKTIEDLKADVLTLTGSLTQVIKVLNAITAPPVVQSTID
jgi:hypothetical protein